MIEFLAEYFIVSFILWASNIYITIYKRKALRNCNSHFDPGPGWNWPIVSGMDCHCLIGSTSGMMIVGRRCLQNPLRQHWRAGSSQHHRSLGSFAEERQSPQCRQKTERVVRNLGQKTCVGVQMNLSSK
jgi:hypothetical protein